VRERLDRLALVIDPGQGAGGPNDVRGGGYRGVNYMLAGELRIGAAAA